MGLEPVSTTLEASTLTTTPSRRYSQVPDMTFVASIDVMLTLLTIYVICI
jgi:biopolymer transport protein ExbD